MGVEADPNPRSAEGAPPVLRRLLPAGDPATVEEIVAGLGLVALGDRAAGRPYVMLNMVSTLDGRVALGGRSGHLGNRADRELFHGLRGAVDAVMVGAGTVRAERYGRIIPEEARRRARREQGLSEEPLACIVSAGLSLPAQIPLIADPAAHVVIVTSSAGEPRAGRRPHRLRAQRSATGRSTCRRRWRELRERFAVHTLLCEGGPHLNSQLLAAGLVDELFLSVSPKLAGGEAAAGQPSLRILAGPELDPPAELELLYVLESDSQLFLRYGVRASAPELVSRETTLNSSLAR